MSFSVAWDNTYKNKEQMSVWPWSHLVSLSYRYGKLCKGMKVLELGCGAGANIPFFLSAGAEYYGIEGSSTMVNFLNEKFAKEDAHIAQADFTKGLYYNGKFDLIIDRSAITHNDTADIRSTLSMVKEALKDEGHFIGVDWFSVKRPEFEQRDVEIIDKYSRDNFLSGYFKRLGRVHFTDKEHLMNLLKDFKIEYMAEKTEEILLPKPGVYAVWDFVVRK